ncbi:LD-carboxypeptidase [Nitrospirillum sp. BR 11828]|uniref:S66 peptidase family protein n=1 Tax=Nitrospirillum sp. BR 11828 TaxID=3104325 RepID=UPI002ACADBF9|nr:LD-carboxypeptidase [Nitrospirillum sp. BR 11828]MDZ5647572.1 LD-carboxypeptidase [Nitrospirillum sp. BR 11828]
MDRRSFLTRTGLATAGLTTAAMITAAGPAVAAGPALLKPPMLRAGDKVGVLDLSTAVYDPAVADRVTAVIEALGLVPVLSPHLLDRSRAFKAAVQERLSDLHGFVADPSIRGVFCARGGYGISEIVDRVDYDLIRRNPKVFLGFSDPTLLHLAIARRAGLVTFHGRMPGLAKFTPYSLEALRRAVCAPEPVGTLRNPEEGNPLRPVYPLRTIAPGQAGGRLVGGNLSMIMAAMGTPWEIDTRGAILMFEDVDEAPYAIARMLWTLRHAGKLWAAAGIVVGACAGCDKPSDASPYGLNEVFDLVLGDLGIPVFSGLALGHTDDTLTVPLGVQAHLDATARTLTVLESGVAA